MMEGELPSVFSCNYRYAKKEHVCCECRRKIPKGVQYQYVKGCWNGEWDEFKTCVACSELREKLKDTYDLSYPPFEELRDWANGSDEPYPPEEIIIYRNNRESQI